MTRSLVLKVCFVPIVSAAAWLMLNQQPLKAACENGGYCDHSYTAYKTGRGVDCNAASSDAAGQIDVFLSSFDACGSGQDLCWTAPKQYDACYFDGAQYVVDA